MTGKIKFQSVTSMSTELKTIKMFFFSYFKMRKLKIFSTSSRNFMFKKIYYALNCKYEGWSFFCIFCFLINFTFISIFLQK